jgi:cell division protein FtsQ
MWDNPRTLNIAAGFLVGIAVLAFSVAGIWLLPRSGLFPVRSIEIASRLEKTTRAEIETAVAGHTGGNFFALPLAELRAGLEQVPWVRRVAVRRVWPDRLEVTLEEHVALARWGEGNENPQRHALINTHGEGFSGKTDQVLPQFVAPAGTEAEVARRYARFSQVIAPLGTGLERVVLTPRFAWQLRLANGLHLMLGRDADQAEARLARFVDAYPVTLGKIPRRHDTVDLRYPNGFALRIPDLKG